MDSPTSLLIRIYELQTIVRGNLLTLIDETDKIENGREYVFQNKFLNKSEKFFSPFARAMLMYIVFLYHQQ